MSFRVNCDVVVVGGGPAGLAAALMLARRGYRDIHVIEKNGPGFFEVDKAYLYVTKCGATPPWPCLTVRGACCRKGTASTRGASV